MNRKLVVTLSMLVLTAALLLSVPAAADSINLALLHPAQTTDSGNTVTFWATVTAPTTNSAPIFLNGDSYNVDTPLSVDDSGFFSFPLFLNPGDSYTGILFAVDVPLTTAKGNYYGYFQILGGSDGNAQNPISNVTPFEVTVIPEPASLLLLGSGVLGLFGVVRRKL